VTHFSRSDYKRVDGQYPRLSFRFHKKLFPWIYLRSIGMLCWQLQTWVDNSVTVWCVLDKLAGFVCHAHTILRMWRVHAQIHEIIDYFNELFKNRCMRKFRPLKFSPIQYFMVSCILISCYSNFHTSWWM